MTIDEQMLETRFEALLDSYGADIGRWPAGVQAQARALAAYRPESGHMLRDAAVFDRLLALAPDGAPASTALTERLLVAIRIEAPRQHARASGNVVSLDEAHAARVRVSVRPQAPPDGRQARARAGGWFFTSSRVAGGGGMLAASLLIGLWLGASNGGATSLGAMFAGRPASSDLETLSEIVRSALPPDLLEGNDEDHL